MRWARALTEPPSCTATEDKLPEAFGTDDSDLEDTERERAYRRSVSEPASTNLRPRLLDALTAVDTSLPFAADSRPTRSKVPPPLVNGLLCAISLVSGGLVPVLVDFSKTAKIFGPLGQHVATPYTTLSLVRAETAFNVAFGLAAIYVMRSPGGMAPLWDVNLHCMMLPLSAVYCIGDIATLCAIGLGGGPLYVALSNSRLLFAALLSHLILDRRQSLKQWMLLAEITIATGAFVVLGAGDQYASGSNGLVVVGTGWALAKAFLSGMAAVLTESRYKQLDLWHANTLLKAQSYLMVLALSVLRQMFVEDLPLCGAKEMLRQESDASDWRCIDSQGWDKWTWAVLVAEISTGWLSVAVLTRMSAISKFLCKTATAPTLYLLYCYMGWGGMRFDTSRFVAVLMIVAGILAYALAPYIAQLRRYADVPHWIRGYPRTISRV